jgi:site-specific DNA-adenine methylase
MAQTPLKWHGGKSYLAPWIISHFPKNYTHYNEVFGGGLSILFAHDPTGKSEKAIELPEGITEERLTEIKNEIDAFVNKKVQELDSKTY